MENKKRKLYTCKCDICGCKFKSLNSLMNMCEDCFDSETDYHIEKSRKDLEWKWKIHTKIKKN